MLESILASRDLLPIVQMNDGTPATSDNWSARRAEMLKLLETYSYGVTPPAPEYVKGEVVREYARCCAGKAFEQEINITFPTNFKRIHNFSTFIALFMNFSIFTYLYF